LDLLSFFLTFRNVGYEERYHIADAGIRKIFVRVSYYGDCNGPRQRNRDILECGSSKKHWIRSTTLETNTKILN